jgi:hypothetical protein
MPIAYENRELLFADDFADFANWHHEGIGEIAPAPEGGMRPHCFGSRQGGEGCMAFFRPDLPDPVAVEYDVTVRSHGGLVINYLAIRGLGGEDLIGDRHKLPPRTGIMANYYSARWGLQSYHVSYSRFRDDGTHTRTSNWRRNPGGLLVGHGIDPCREVDRAYHVRITKDRGHCQFFADGRYAHGVLDRDTAAYPIPDTGKFGFRLIGSDVMADVAAFRAYRLQTDKELWEPWP